MKAFATRSTQPFATKPQDENQLNKPVSKRSTNNVRIGGPLANITNNINNNKKPQQIAKKASKATALPKPTAGRVRTFADGNRPVVSQAVPQPPIVEQTAPLLVPISTTVHPLALESLEDKEIDPMVIDDSIIIEPSWEDIDETDHDDPLQATDYVNDIYEYLREKELRDVIDPNYMTKQVDINERMRAILVDWMAAVHLKFRLLPETLFLSVNLVDRFLELKPVARGKLQLVSITAMLLAAKFEEIYPPECNDFVYITDKSYTKEEILDMEIQILVALDYNLTVATALHFLRRFSKAARSDWKAHTLSKYLIEIPLLDLKMLKYPPSLIAGSAVFLARKMLQTLPAWNPTLEHYSTYSIEALKPCVLDLNELLQKVQKSSLKTLRRKYTGDKFGNVAKIELIAQDTLTIL